MFVSQDVDCGPGACFDGEAQPKMDRAGSIANTGSVLEERAKKASAVLARAGMEGGPGCFFHRDMVFL